MNIHTYAVAGMTCGHCVFAVTEEISALPGVIRVSVELVAGGPSQVRVTSDKPLDASAVASAVHEAGYQLLAPPAAGEQVA